MSMSKNATFFLGFALAILLCGIGAYIVSKEAAKQSISTFIVGYAMEVSTLAFILDEKDDSKRMEIARSELCEAISLMKSKLEKESFDREYIELVVSKPLPEYQLFLNKLGRKHCGKSI